MRLLSAVCAIVTLASTFCGAAHAQDAVTFGPAVGAEGVTGAFRNARAFRPGVAGAAVSVSAQFPLSASHLALRADLAFHQLGSAPCPNFCVASRFDTRIASGGLSLIARLNDPHARFSPYVLAGAAAYISDFADGNITAMHPSHLGPTGGVGVEGRFGVSTAFVELRYMGIPPGGVMPVVLGVRF